MSVMKMLLTVEQYQFNCIVEKLESFQSQLSKRILRLSKTTANMTPLIALRWPSIRARVVCRKLGFLQRTIKNESGLSSEVLTAIAADDIKTSLAVKQCSELEKPFQTSHTNHTITAGLMGEEVQRYYGKRLVCHNLIGRETSINHTSDNLCKAEQLDESVGLCPQQRQLWHKQSPCCT